MNNYDIFLSNPANFKFEIGRQWLIERAHWVWPVTFVYITSIFAIQNFMQKRQAYNLKSSLIVWNIVLSIFSTLGAWFVGNQLFFVLYKYGFHVAYCQNIDNHSFFDGWVGYFSFLFCVSKIVELVDSYFLVLRKRPLTFLQYYHHAMTLIYCWLSYPSQPTFNVIGSVLNYSVHSVMYLYFAVRALQIKVPVFVPRLITALQIIQFLINNFVLLYGYYQIHINGQVCNWSPFWTNFAILMNLSYIFLFVQFFYNAYVMGQHSTLKKTQ